LNFDKFSENVRNRLLLKLAEKDGFQDWIRRMIEYMSYKNPLETINLISTVRSKIDKDFALKILGEISKYGDGEVRTNAKALMNAMREDVKE